MPIREGVVRCSALACGLAVSSAAAAFPSILSAFQSRYPTSTIPARMTAQFGQACFTCHHPPATSLPGNCFRNDIILARSLGLSNAAALEALDRVDSDGDGVPNGVEILTARGDGQVGFSPGLVGPTGADNCYSIQPGVAVTNTSETPAWCYANCDGSTTIPVLNALDFACFLNDFTRGRTIDVFFQERHYANCDGSTAIPVLNALDFACYLQRYTNGCP